MYMRQPYQLKLQLKLKFHEISPADFGVHKIIQAYTHTLRVPLDLAPEVTMVGSTKYAPNIVPGISIGVDSFEVSESVSASCHSDCRPERNGTQRNGTERNGTYFTPCFQGGGTSKSTQPTLSLKML